MRILCYILVVLFVTTTAVGQQINPVPDYIFRNSMSVGRNAPTDTSAYFSIGPRFGATRGFMPPMVVDTAAVTGTKRNGLLIYSIQRNSYLYWDSTGSKWSRIAANLDTLQLATRAWRQKGDDSLAARIATASDTNTISTRAWRQKGIDSVASVRIGGSGVTGFMPKFTATRTLDSSQIFQLGGNIGIGTANPTQKLQVFGNVVFNNGASNTNLSFIQTSTERFRIASRPDVSIVQMLTFGYPLQIQSDDGHEVRIGQNSNERMRIFANGRIGVNTTTDAGYQFDVAGSMRNTTDAYFATNSGNVSIGTSDNSTARLVVRNAIGSNIMTMIGQGTGGQTFQWYQGTASALVLGIPGKRLLGIAADGTFFTGNISSDGGAGAGLWVDGTTNNVGIKNITAPSEALHVGGRIRATTIDSSASPINMLWATPTGVISKTAPPAFMVSSNATAAASWNFARDVTNSGNISRVTRTHDNAGDTTVTFHIAVYIATASFTTGSWVEVATLPTGYRPNEVVYGSLPDFVSGDVYEAQNGTDFAADAEYTGATVFRVLKDGKVQVRVATVTSSVTLSGTNNVLFPISFTFTVRPISV